jgi:hypothetical protein
LPAGLSAILQPHEHRAARRVAHIADLPVVALTASGRQIVTAHRLGLPAKAVCKFCGVTGHHRLPLADALDRPAAQHALEHRRAGVSVGTNMRSFLIS